VTVQAPPRINTRATGTWLVAAAAIFFPVVYLVSDVIETAQGDFSTFRLTLTYIGEAGFPLFVIGLAAVLHQTLPPWAILGAVGYAYSYVFFTGTVVWALVAHTPNWETLGDDFGRWMTAHGAVMVMGGVAFGVGIARSGALPAWTGWALAVGVGLVAVAAGMGNLERTVAAAIPDAAFIGMGIALMRTSGGHWPSTGCPQAPFHSAGTSDPLLKPQTPTPTGGHAQAP
jgi:hypothetical protein